MNVPELIRPTYPCDNTARDAGCKCNRRSSVRGPYHAKKCPLFQAASPEPEPIEGTKPYGKHNCPRCGENCRLDCPREGKCWHVCEGMLPTQAIEGTKESKLPPVVYHPDFTDTEKQWAQILVETCSAEVLADRVIGRERQLLAALQPPIAAAGSQLVVDAAMALIATEEFGRPYWAEFAALRAALAALPSPGRQNKWRPSR